MRSSTRRPLVAGVLAAALCLSGLGAASAAVWLPPAQLGAASTQVIGNPSVAVAPNGRALVAYDASDGTTRSTVVSTADGPDLGAPQSLAGPASSGPVVAAVDPQGNETVAWQLASGALVTAYRPAGQGWQPAQTVAPTATSSPSLAVGDAGAGVVAFSANEGSAERAYVVTRSAGASTFSAPAALSPVSATGDDTIFGTPVVAMDAAGDYLATWQRSYDPDGGGPLTHDYYDEAVAKPVAGVLTDVKGLTPLGGGTAPTTPTVAMARTGDAVVVWDFQPTSGARRIDYVRFVPGSTFATGSFGSTTTIPTLGTSPGRPRVALSDAGAATVVLATSLGVEAVTRPGPAAGFSSPQALSTAGADTFNAAVHVGAAGSVVAWRVNAGDTWKLFAAQAPPGAATFGPPVLVAAKTRPAGGFDVLGVPALGADDEGNARLASVESFNPGGTGASTTYTLLVATLDAAAPKLGAVTVPATATARTPITVAAAATDRLSVPTLSWSFGDGGTATGAAPSHTYAAAGTYTVTLTATDRAGQPTSTTRTVTVAAAAPAVVPGKAKLTTSALPDGRTLVKKLTVKGLAKGDEVKLRCKGAGCTKKAKASVKAKKGTVALSAYVGGLKLAPKARLTVTVTRAGLAPLVVTYTMVKGKKPTRS